MRILLIHQNFLEKDDSGGSRFNEMVKIWSELGHKVTVLCGMVHYSSGVKNEKYKGKFIYREIYSENVMVIRSHVSEAYNANFMGRLWAYFSFMFSSLVAGLVYARNKNDLILASSPPLFVGISALLLSRIKKIPFVFEIRDLWPESAIDTGVLRNRSIIRLSFWFERFIYNKSIRINVLTPAFQDILISQKNITPQKIFLIPNAADFSISDSILENFDRNTFRKEHNLNDKFVIIYVGAHGVANHLIQLIETAEIVKGSNVMFLSIGSGMQKQFLINEVAKRNLTNIKFLDPVPKSEVFKFIMASDAGASILKKTETFKTVLSNKTFDYMACKRPIFMLIDGISHDLVEKANCGYYVLPENPEDFAQKINKMLDLNTDQRLELGHNGYVFAKKYYDRKTLAKEYINKLEKLTEKK